MSVLLGDIPKESLAPLYPGRRHLRIDEIPYQWAWLTITAVNMLVVLAYWRFVPIVWDIVTYAQSYADGHVKAYGWSQGRYLAFVSVSYLLDIGPLAALGLLQVFLTWLLSSNRRAS